MINFSNKCCFIGYSKSALDFVGQFFSCNDVGGHVWMEGQKISGSNLPWMMPCDNRSRFNYEWSRFSWWQVNILLLTFEIFMRGQDFYHNRPRFYYERLRFSWWEVKFFMMTGRYFILNGWRFEIFLFVLGVTDRNDDSAWV